MTGRRDPAAAAETAIDVLRELVRDAHAATKDLRAAIREARQVGAGLADDVTARVSAEYRAAMDHLQAEQNRNAAILNAAVDRARDAVIEALTLAELEPDPEGKTLTVRWRGGKFDEDAQVKELRGGGKG